MTTGKLLLASVLLLCGTVSIHAQTLDELHKKALSEGGTLNFYATLAQVNASTILPTFEKRFPGVKVNHVDATSDQLAARIIAESRGG
jgi:ABC-type glycerol-3-phosphate transport system substrate-binding protein